MGVKKYSKLNISEIIIICWTILFMCNFILREYIPIGNYVDEILELIIIFFALFKFIFIKNKKDKLEREEKLILLSSLLLMVDGIIGNMISSYQLNGKAILIDIIGWQKFFLVFVSMMYLINDKKIDKYKSIIVKFSKIFIVTYFILYILNLIGVFHFMTYIEKSINMLSFSLGKLAHPSSAVALTALAVSILFMDYKKNKLYIILGLILSIMTFKTKAYGFVALILFFFIFSKNKISYKKIFAVFLFLLLVGGKEIFHYFFNPGAQRTLLLQTSLAISCKFIPFGSGFATFGTTMSGAYYSKAYALYHLNHLWGLTPDYYAYISDGGWSSVFGQFGFLGLILIMSSLILMFLSYRKKTGDMPESVMSIIGLFGYIFIISTNDCFFNADMGVVYAMVIAIIIRYYQKKKGEKK